MYVNHAWERLLGYTQIEVQGKSIYSFVDPSDLEKFIAYRKDVINNNTPDKEIIIKVVTKGGAIVVLEGFVSTKFEEENPLYTRGIFRDITIRLQQEAELREREKNLQQLLHYAPDAVVVINSQSIIAFWNPKAEAIFGWSAEEVMSKSLTSIIIPPQFREAHDNGMRRYLATGEVRVLNKTIEITALNKEGREFYVSLTISQTSQKGEVAFIAFVRDIDLQKRNALELEQKKLQLELSNQELEQFAHVASHDMKEPSRKIRLFSEQIKFDSSNVLSEKSKVYIDKIEKAAVRLTKMVDGVLTYSSINGVEAIDENVDLNAVLDNVENDLELIIQENDAEIKRDHLPFVNGVSLLLYQLFYNLVNNALKFTRDGVNPVIEIFAYKVSQDELENYPVDHNSNYIKIHVKDNGIGFSQEDANKIFKTFTRLHSKDQFEGTGLGLSLCKSIVNKHKGIIEAFGEANAGATFVVLLPLKP